MQKPQRGATEADPRGARRTPHRVFPRDPHVLRSTEIPLAQLQATAGNRAARRVASAPQSPIRRALWTKEAFTKETYEFAARRSSVQIVIDSLLDTYHATEAKDVNKGKRLALLKQMDEAAQIWIANHTIETREGEVEEDTARKARMAGMKKFLINVGTEKAEVSSTGPVIDDLSSFGETDSFKKLKAKYDGNASRVFTGVAGLIDAAVPNRGDKATLDVEMTIPIASSGAFIGGHLLTTVERTDDDLVKARTTLTVTGGTSAWIAKFKAEMGGYVEASASNGAEVMSLYSYGLYRRFRESKVIPERMTNYMWGGRGSSYGKKKSEEWSRAVEEGVFQQAFDKYPDPDPSASKYSGMTPEQKTKAIDEDKKKAATNRSKFYVETGGTLSVQAALVLAGDSTGISATVLATSGRKITADSIKKAKGGLGAKNQLVGGWTGAQKQLGEDTGISAVLKLAASISAGPISGSVMGTRTSNKWTYAFTGAGNVPIDQLTSDGLGTAVAGFAIGGAKLARTLVEDVGKEKGKAQTVGVVADSGEDLAFAFTQLAKTPGKSFTPDWDVTKKSTPSTALKGSASVGVKLVGTVVREKGADGKWAVTGGSVEASLVKTKKVSVGVLAGKLEKSSRIFKVTYASGSWSVS